MKSWRTILFFYFLFNGFFASGQTASLKFNTNLEQSLNTDFFIENIGQYNNPDTSIGTVQFAYEGHGMPVLFTSKGLVFLQRQKDNTHKENDENLRFKERYISLQWKGCNPNAAIITEEKVPHYNTYGLIQKKAWGYKKITYKNIYPGIDMLFSFGQNNTIGFEYSIVVHPGADAGLVKMLYNGDIKSIETNTKGSLVIQSDIKGFVQSLPQCFMVRGTDAISPAYLKKNASAIPSPFIINKNEIGFDIPVYDKTQTLVIDPFVSPTDTLTGPNYSQAIDIDYDFEGNVYVSGGGNLDSFYLAKFSSQGVLQWRFGKNINIPPANWAFHGYDGWVVEKTTGNIFLGSKKVIRLNTFGMYDNYMSVDFTSKNCKTIFNCNNGQPELWLGGKDGSVNNFSILNLVTSAFTSRNLTGINSTQLLNPSQNIADVVIDPIDQAMYSIYAAKEDTLVANHIFKHNYPYINTSRQWVVKSGTTVLVDNYNRSYLDIGGVACNSVNMLAVNANYLFYWDGQTLLVYSKATGNPAGIPMQTTLLPKKVGGIYADDCNNVFIGYTNGTIKVLKFTGINFNDAVVPDITIPGHSSSSVYDLVFDNKRGLLYACGNGFVSAFDMDAYCRPASMYHLSVTTNCNNNTAIAVLSPAAPPASTITYSLYSAGNFITSNTSGVFTGLSAATSYLIKAIINQNCNAYYADSAAFIYPCVGLSAITTKATCGLSNGSITVSPTGGVQPFTFSMDGINFQTGNSFFNLGAGNYIITAKDGNNITQTVSVDLDSILTPKIAVASTPVTCLQAGLIYTTGSGGTPPYQYSMGGINYQALNIFYWYPAGTYRLFVKDANGCIDSVISVIGTAPKPIISASVENATCGRNNGKITANATSGVPRYLFSLDNSAYQSSNIFNNLAPGTYVVYITDINNCIDSTTVTIINTTQRPTFTYTVTPASCRNNDGTITINAAGGTPGYFYGINGVYQASNVFTGIAVGSYIADVIDQNGNGCLSDTQMVNINLSPINSVVVDAGSLPSICKGDNININASSNGSSFIWSPAQGISNPAILNPIASPGITTTYFLTASIGICNKSDSITITVLPLPVANAGADKRICNNTSAQLNGSGGMSYMWSPPLFLSNITISNPVVLYPTGSIKYFLRVRDINGCISLADTIKITVLPPAKLFAGTDTVIVKNQPLPLFSKDVNNLSLNHYIWKPATGLSNPFIPNPIAVLEYNTSYSITAISPEGCVASDTINIKVFKEIEIYVPKAFTPNNDGLNDILKAIPVGIKEFKYFNIYDRWGHTVFATTDNNKGWDGTIKGISQPAGSYVWIAAAIDYNGEFIQRKGAVLLIR